MNQLSAFHRALMILLVLLPVKSFAGWNGIIRGAGKFLRSASKSSIKHPGRVPACIDDLCARPVIIRASGSAEKRFIHSLAENTERDVDNLLARLRQQEPMSFTLRGQTHRGWVFAKGKNGYVVLSSDEKSVFKFPRMNNEWDSKVKQLAEFETRSPAYPEDALRFAFREVTLLQALQEAGLPVVRSVADCEFATGKPFVRKPFVRGLTLREFRGFMEHHPPPAGLFDRFELGMDNLVGDVSYFHQKRLPSWLEDHGLTTKSVGDSSYADLNPGNIMVVPTQAQGQPELGLFIIDP